MSANSLCFEEARAARKTGEIDLKAFLRHIVAHYGGLRHAADAEGQRPYLSAHFEDEVRSLVLGKTFQPLDDNGTASIYSIFLGGFEGDSATVRRLIESSGIVAEYYLRPLIEISVLSGDAQLLRICFENDFLGSYLDCEHLLSSRIGNNPSIAWLHVLFDFDFRQWRTDPQQLCQWRSWRHLLFMGADCTHWWIAHGGRTPHARGLFEHTTAWSGAPTIRVLLDQFGVGWFTDSGTLQLAVKHNDMETVKMLVEAGADVDELVTDWQMDERERRAAPLRALQMAAFANSEEMVRYLVKHGARLTLKELFIPDYPYHPLPKEIRVLMDLVVELDAVKEGASL